MNLYDYCDANQYFCPSWKYYEPAVLCQNKILFLFDHIPSWSLLDVILLAATGLMVAIDAGMFFYAVILQAVNTELEIQITDKFWLVPDLTENFRNTSSTCISV